MTTVRELIKEGRLGDATAAAADAARREPARAEHRVLLFQLYAVGGAWDRALRQLDVLSDLDPKMELLARTCRPLISAEALRASVFKGERAPLCLGRPPDWLAPLVEALHLDGEGRHAEAAALRADAFDAAPAVPGTIDGKAFAWLADGDERLGPVLEAVVNGSCWWIPLMRIARIELDPPEDLRDLVWLPARFTWANQGEAVGFVPARYPGSESSDDAHKLSRRTDWHQLGDGSWAGIGQRMLATDLGEHPLLEVREIVLEATDGGDG